MKIIKIIGREIYDSAGLPTLACEVILEGGISVTGSVPAGTSIGMYEGKELRDGGRRLFGLGVLKAIERLENIIAPVLIGKVPDVLQGDLLMLQLDGTPDKSFLGANTLTALSIALARGQALTEQMELFELVAHLIGNDSVTVPFPMVNIFSGGRHADNPLFFQEIMVVPIGAESYRNAIEIIAQINVEVERLLKKLAIPYTISSEGAFAPVVEDETEVLDILMQVIQSHGHDTCMLALDVAASHFYDTKRSLYHLHGEFLNSSELISVYKDLVSRYPIYSIEDGLDQNDVVGWVALTQAFGESVQIVGDDIFASNTARIQQGVEIDAATAAIIKPNQVGTVSEALDALNFAKNHGLNTIVSHRSRETTDPFIVDFSVGSSAGQIKLGGFRGGRMGKYNRLLMIEDMLMNNFLF